MLEPLTRYLVSNDGKSFVTSVSPASLTLASGSSGSVTVNLFAPQSASAGTDDSITLIATSATNPAVTNSSVQTVEVLSGDSIPPTITVSANPPSLWPPNGKMVPVVVSGTATDASGINLSSGTYSFAVSLQSLRNGNDKDGRQYTIAVQAEDNAGNVGSASTLVVVPHDQGH
jgi:hypothetical protein